MSPAARRIAAAFAATAVLAFGCGPFFPDTVLDLPQAALRVRSTCFLDEMIAVDRATGSGFSNTPAARAMLARSRQPPAETAAGPGMVAREAAELSAMLRAQGVAQRRVAEITGAFEKWRAALPEASFDGPCAIAAPPVAGAPPPPDLPEVPADIRAYWAAARAFRAGDAATARAGWQAILELPPAERKHRAVWAAWMLAKTAPDPASALPFYQRIGQLVAEGCDDALNLAAGALGWRAWREEDPVAAIKLYFQAACAGEEMCFTSLRRQVAGLLVRRGENLARAAADPLAREVVTAVLFALRDGPCSADADSDPVADSWLALLEAQPAAKPSWSGAKAAWLCYGRGQFDAARRWLARAPAGAGEVLWLEAKLALRDGRLDQAARLFAKAAPFYQLDCAGPAAEPHLDELRWFDHRARRDWLTGQFLSDRAIVHVARGEFLQAMDFLAKAGYHDDAAYLAERVLTTDELVGWVKSRRPVPPEAKGAPVFWLAPDGSVHPPDGDWAGDPLRHLLARRLAREFRFREAAEFMPAALRPLFAHYVALHRAARSGHWPDETKAVILWNLAKLRRHLGMEFFGYEGAPDNARWGGDYEATELADRRQGPGGWHRGWGEAEAADLPLGDGERAVPPVAPEELERLAEHRPACDRRFHYRYEAAEIAWRAAALLPDDHQGTLFILHEAGRWLANRDPQAADRFYQEIVRRCKRLPQGDELDRRRWFFPRPPLSGLPPLPPELRFSQPEVACLATGGP